MIKTLARSVREYKLPALLSPVCMVGEVAMEVLIPLVMAKLYDFGIEQQNMTVVVQQSVLLMLLAVISLGFGCASADLASKAATGFAKNLRHDMYYRVQEFSFSNIDKFSASSIVTRLTSDVANIQMAFQMMIRMAIRCPVMLVLALFSAARISLKLSLIYCVALPLLALVIFCLIPTVFKIFDKVFKTYDSLNNVVQENIHGIRVVKSFVREDKEIEKFSGISGEIYRLFCKAEHIIALNSPVMQICVYGCILAISWFGARMVVASGNLPGAGLTTGELSSMFTYTTQILTSLMMLSAVLVMTIMSRSPMRRCAELLTEEPNLVSPENAVKEVKDGSIDFENVSFRYSEKARLDALQNVNLHIPSGCTVGILGATGSSKSTLVQLIPRLYDVTQGTVRVGGVDVRDYDLDALRSAVAMVLQKITLFSGTIRENITYGCEHVTEEQLAEVVKAANLSDLVEGLPQGLDTMVGEHGGMLSGGQRQRISIARALIRNPKIIVLDEATSALDSISERLIQEALQNLTKGRTTFIVAHRLSTIRDADKIAVIADGHCVEYGTFEELMEQKGEFYRMKRIQS